jgi:hypothetical protein
MTGEKDRDRRRRPPSGKASAMPFAVRLADGNSFLPRSSGDINAKAKE